MTTRFVQYHPRARVGDGGITGSVRELSAAMAAAGAVAVIAYEDDGMVAAPQRRDGVEWVPVVHRRIGRQRLPVGLGAALAGADWLVLNSAWTVHNVRAGAVAGAAGVPYIVAPRGAYDPLIRQRRKTLKRAWWLAAERRLVHEARALHVFFDAQAEAVRAMGFRGDLIVAPNGVRVPESWTWDGGSGGYLLYVGRFDPEHKGLDLLVEAVAALPAQRRPQLRLHGPDWRGGKERVAALVRGLGVGRWVSLGEPVYGARKWALMASARGFVYPSRWEGFGNAPAEAAALGVPVLATGYPLGRYLEERGAAVVCAGTVRALGAGLEALAGGLVDVGRQSAVVRRELSWTAVARSWLDQVAALT